MEPLLQVRFNGDGTKPTPTHTYESLVSWDLGASWQHLEYAPVLNGVATRIDAATGDLLGNCLLRGSLCDSSESTT